MVARSCRSLILLAGFSSASLAACGGLSQERQSGGAEPGLGSAGGQSTGNGAGGGEGGSLAAAGSGAVAAVAGAGGSSIAPPPVARTPVKHRAVAASCDHERPPGTDARSYNEELVPCSDAGSCPVDETCTECVSACIDFQDGLGLRCARAYGECLSDADCTAGDNGRCQDNRGRFFCSYDTCYSDATCTTGGPCACEGQSGSPGNTCLPGNCQTDADCGSGGFCSPTFGGCGNYSGVIAYYCHTAADTCVDDADCVDPAQGAGYCMYSPERGHWACGYGQCVG